MIHFELELFDGASHFVSAILRLLNDVIDLVPVQLVGNGIVDDENGAVDLQKTSQKYELQMEEGEGEEGRL